MICSDSSEKVSNRYDESFCIFSFVQDADGIWRTHLKLCYKIILMIAFGISFFWLCYAIYAYINQSRHVGLFVFVGVFFAVLGFMGIISCYTRHFEVDPINQIIVYGMCKTTLLAKMSFLMKFESVDFLTIEKRETAVYPVTTLPSYSILLVDKLGNRKFILSGNYKDIIMIANSIGEVLTKEVKRC